VEAQLARQHAAELLTMDSRGVIALLAGGAPVEWAEWSFEYCEELCALLRRRAPVTGGRTNAMNFEGRNANGDTAFLLACHMGHAECMRLLVAAGCITAAKSNNGTTALMHTAISGNAAAVRTALAAGWCDLEATDSDGDTAFLLACNRGHVECMQLLVAAGCNTAAANDKRQTATDVAQAAGNSAAVQWLREEFAERERRARIAEADLMAMLDSEPATTNRSSVRQRERKKEKRRRQQQAKREAAARRTQAMTSYEPEQRRSLGQSLGKSLSLSLDRSRSLSRTISRTMSQLYSAQPFKLL
jgi:hypothetical protein